MNGTVSTTTLYKMDKKKKIRVWSIEGYEFEMLWEHGQLDGEQQENSEYVVAKAGRTQQEQLKSQIDSKINKQKDKGYVESLEEAKIGRVRNRLGFKHPMKAQKLKDQKQDIDIENEFYQYKYNGHRCVVHNVGGKLIAYSKNGQIIDSVPHVMADLNGHIDEGFSLDGELYCHGVTLNKISSWVRKFQPDSLRLKFFVYDCFYDSHFDHHLENLKFIERNEIVTNSLDSSMESIIIAPVLPFDVSPKTMLNKAIELGYEGIMLRVKNGIYEDGARSKVLLKIKKFDDAEFEIVDIVESKDGWAILHVITESKIQFAVSCHGTIPYKTKVLINRKDYIGQFVNIEFSEWTEYGKPFHPVATNFVNEISIDKNEA
jgi:DNA ligase-1